MFSPSEVELNCIVAGWWLRVFRTFCGRRVEAGGVRTQSSSLTSEPNITL